MPRRRDGRQHGRVSFVAIMVNLHPAGQELAAGDAADATLQRAQVAVALGRRLRSRFVAPVAWRAELACPALHPVDAEHQVKDRAHHGRQPGQPDPTRSRRHLALAQQRVRGDERGEDEVRREQRRGPDAKQVGPEIVHGDVTTLPWQGIISKP